jgi:DNA polymerase II large subunit
MAKYSTADKKEYLKYYKKMKKKGAKAKTFATWMVEDTTKMKDSDTARSVYKMSNRSKQNRGKMASNKKDRP